MTGPLDYPFRTYTILPETTLVPVGGLTVTPAPAAGPNQFTIASFNLERFYDDVNDPGGDVALTALAYSNRLNKASLAIRNVLNMPDIIGVQEVEKLTAAGAGDQGECGCGRLESRLPGVPVRRQRRRRH